MHHSVCSCAEWAYRDIIYPAEYELKFDLKLSVKLRLTICVLHWNSARSQPYNYHLSPPTAGVGHKPMDYEF